MTQPTTTAKRFEYIDAMRGFTMLLVVLGHVIMYSYHESEETIVTFNQAIICFLMPLFFLISGFVFYKATRVWYLEMIRDFLSKKVMTLIFPTLFFLVIYDLLFNYNIVKSFQSVTQYGYWFTITLFEYFVVYSVLSFFVKKINSKQVEIAIWILACTASLFAAEACAILENIVPPFCLGLFGINTMRYFSFFFLGTLLKKHFDLFVKKTDNCFVMAFVILLFFAEIVFTERIDSVIMPDGGVPFILIYEFRFLLTGVLGAIIVFTFFRKNESSFAQNTRVGRCLQYVGRRTLDVYLLHYFFLPRNLEMVGRFFKDNANPSIEFFVSLLIAVWVVVLCLCMSNVLRLSSFMEHYLFGVKRKNTID